MTTPYIIHMEYIPRPAVALPEAIHKHLTAIRNALEKENYTNTMILARSLQLRERLEGVL